jgi:hypothetical protein
MMVAIIYNILLNPPKEEVNRVEIINQIRALLIKFNN